MCHIISLWPKVPLQRDESIIGCHGVLAVDEVSLMNHHWVNLQAAAAARASVILSILGFKLKTQFEITFFECTERLFNDVCHIISLWLKVSLQQAVVCCFRNIQWVYYRMLCCGCARQTRVVAGLHVWYTYCS